MRDGWSAPRNGRFTPGKDPVPHCTGGWVGSRAGCGKSRPPPGFDPRTIQPVASRYTDWATPTTFNTNGMCISTDNTNNMMTFMTLWHSYHTHLKEGGRCQFFPELSVNYLTYQEVILPRRPPRVTASESKLKDRAAPHRNWFVTRYNGGCSI